MFSERLKRYRQEKGWTQEELAKKIYVTRSAVAKWEQGRGLPSKESLELLCKLFDVQEGQLLDYGDVDKDMRRNRKSTKRKWIAVFVSVAVALASVATPLILVLTKKTVTYNPVWINTPIAKEYLRSVGLDNLPIVTTKAGEDTYLQSFTTESDYRNFVTTIDSYGVFEDYMGQVFDYLMFSDPYISYVSSAVEHPEDGWRNETDGRFSQNFNTYLVPIQDRTDALESRALGEDGIPTHESYVFYYVRKLDGGHKEGEAVDPFRITFTYYGTKQDLLAVQDASEEGNTFLQGNFQMEISVLGSDHETMEETFEKDDGSTETVTFDRFNYYLASELYDIRRVALDDSNFSEYFRLSYEPGTQGFGYLWLRSGRTEVFSPLFRVLCDGTIRYVDPVTGLWEEMTTLLFFKQDSPFCAVLGTDVELTDCAVREGSSLFLLERKEGAFDPYPDRAYYL